MSYSNTNVGGDKPADPYKPANEEDPGLKEKIEDLSTFVDRNKFCMMTTKVASSNSLASRCMAVAAKEGNGADFIFHTNSESGKTDDLAAHPDVNLAFLNNSGEWASISGKATVVSDRESVRAHYSPSLKAWLGDLGDGKHDGGPEDPRIVLIRVQSETAQYAISRKNIIASAVEIAKGVVMGEPAAVNKLRHLSSSELQQARA